MTTAEPRTEETSPNTGSGSHEHRRDRRRQLARAKQRVGRSMQSIGSTLERPIVGAGVAGGLVAIAAGLWGPVEAALGAFVGLTAYRMLKQRHQRRRQSQQAREVAASGATPGSTG